MATVGSEAVTAAVVAGRCAGEARWASAHARCASRGATVAKTAWRRAAVATAVKSVVAAGRWAAVVKPACVATLLETTTVTRWTMTCVTARCAVKAVAFKTRRIATAFKTRGATVWRATAVTTKAVIAT